MRGDLWVGEWGSRLGTSSFFSLYHVVPEFRNMLGFAQFLLAREHKRIDENGKNELCIEAVENFSSNGKKRQHHPPVCCCCQILGELLLLLQTIEEGFAPAMVVVVVVLLLLLFLCPSAQVA
jgi:hypothetical protein